MLGAIYGDIAGSVYEYNNLKRIDAPLFIKGSSYTDDTVVSVGVARGLLDCESLSDIVAVKKKIKEGIRTVCREYPLADYGGGFAAWLSDEIGHPYGSYGNGAAMRVGAICWLCNSIEQALSVARLSAEITHNHPDGIKGAEATVGAAYLARGGASKAQIRAFIEKYYPIDFTLDDIRNGYQYELSCYGTVRPAMVAFLESDSFEDAIRRAISVGGDSDTLAAITGIVAEAYYGMTDEQIDLTLSYLEGTVKDITLEFLEKRGDLS